ncbi:hypothetical protein GZH47_13565 [Paenibacillus rhizovicinus]|uniref:Uncharacterized protein n=1 Tax=Paenibacillus rhizovicinus TaxID=2704463 RepID=A0A6C0NZU3_9BACL|nr:hypothetical protein [Paenibacillus rhizovicinus]QHW31765.1 hypothetical protein GZH47_13565 [Paenibacillus rhizovicinus]
MDREGEGEGQGRWASKERGSPGEMGGKARGVGRQARWTGKARGKGEQGKTGMGRRGGRPSKARRACKERCSPGEMGGKARG